MAKRKTATKRKTVTAAKTPIELLEYMNKNATRLKIGASLRQQIKAALDRTSDPFINRPIINGFNPHSDLNTKENKESPCRIWLGSIEYAGDSEEYTISLVHDRYETSLRIGCAREYSEDNARTHWANDHSRESGYDRPGVNKIIDWAAAICKFKGWNW